MGYSFNVCHIYQQSMGNGQVANICASPLFPHSDIYPQVTAVYYIYQL